MVDLQHIGLAHLVQHHIDPQNMEAHIPHFVLGLAEAVLVSHEGMPQNQRLYNCLMQFPLYFIQIKPTLLYQFEDRCEGSLVAHIHALAARVEYELGVLLVYRVVG